MMARKPTPDVLDELMRQPAASMVQVPLDEIDDNPYQPRQQYNQESLEELAASIEANGLQQPPAGRRLADGRVQLVFGHRRRRAYDVLRAKDGERWASMPVMIVEASDEDMAARAWTENVEREDLTAVEQAQAIQRMVESFGWTQARVAERLGLAPATVANKLRLLRAPAEVQEAVAQGTISERQAGAMAPLWDLPPEATQRLNQWSDLPSIMNRALDGASSDQLRSHVDSALQAATKELPDHWRGYNFGDLAGVEQAKCANCPRIVRRKDEQRCALPRCWAAKSSAWLAIESREVVELTGVAIAPEQMQPNEYDNFYSSASRELLGVPEKADRPAEHQCANLRVRKSYRNDWEFFCYHPGAATCACVAKAQSAAKKDGKAQWKTLRSTTEGALAKHIATFPLDALRLLARVYGKWEQREQVVNWTAQECSDQIVKGLIKVFEPYEPHANLGKARIEMEKLIAISGAPNPWTVPHAAASTERPEVIDASLAGIGEFIAEFQAPGDGLPTPESISLLFDNLNLLSRLIASQPSEYDRLKLQSTHTKIYADLAALSDRVQASYGEEIDHA